MLLIIINPKNYDLAAKLAARQFGERICAGLREENGGVYWESDIRDPSYIDRTQHDLMYFFAGVNDAIEDLKR